MFELKFNNNKKALKKLSKVECSIDKFLKKHPKSLSNKEHKKLRKLLKSRAFALSNATDLKIHSLFD